MPVNRRCGKVSPLFKQRELRRRIFLLFQQFGPVFFRSFKESAEVDAVHEHYPHHGCKSREAPGAFDALLDGHEQQVGYERHPDLYLYGIGALAVEVPEREILLQLLEEQLDLPSFPVDGHDVFGIHVHVVGEELYGSCPCLLHVDAGDDPGVMDDAVYALDLPGEDDVPDPVPHTSVLRHQHGVVPGLVDEALLHLGHIDGSAPGKLLGLRVVDIGPVDGGDVALRIVGFWRLRLSDESPCLKVA